MNAATQAYSALKPSARRRSPIAQKPSHSKAYSPVFSMRHSANTAMPVMPTSASRSALERRPAI